MDLNEISVFVKVVQAGSFNGAARQLGMPNSTVSAKVSSLEKRLGVTLLQRTTRKLNLTEAGDAYFRHCLQGLERILSAEVEVSSSQQQPQGRLRVTAPVDMGNTFLVDLISNFTKLYPQVSLEFLFTDRWVDLIGEGVDLAIRAGDLKNSGLIAKKLGTTYWAPFASAAYLKKAGTPSHPKELRHHSCLQFTPLGEESWQLSNHKIQVTVSLEQRILGNDVNLLKALAIAGNGIVLLPTFVCHSEVRSGKLNRILPEWQANSHPIHLVYPEQKFVVPKVRAFVDVAIDVFKRVIQGGI